jgi:hypothetical protein
MQFLEFKDQFITAIASASFSAGHVHEGQKRGTYAAWGRIVSEITGEKRAEVGPTLPYVCEHWGRLSPEQRETLVAYATLLFGWDGANT